jgi:hypothetical protein
MPIIDFSIIKVLTNEEKSFNMLLLPLRFVQSDMAEKMDSTCAPPIIDISTKISTPSNFEESTGVTKQKTILFALSKLIKGHKNLDITEMFIFASSAFFQHYKHHF